MVQKSIRYFHAHYEELTKEYGHAFLLIYNAQIIGSFNSRREALIAGSKKYSLGTFAVQETGVERLPRIGPIIRRASS